jgi:2-polyprenyl-6-methoxyphenol hydroxylase-like FAD-dependent oxidoreductase
VGRRRLRPAGVGDHAGVAELLDNIGVWDAIAADRATAYQAMQVWDRPGIGEIRFDAAELGEPDLGHIVENRVIVRALWRALRRTGVAAADAGRPARFHACRRRRDPVAGRWQALSRPR